MARPKKLPKHVRRHSRGGFRATLLVDGRRKVGPLRATVVEATDDAERMLEARDRSPTQLWTLQVGLDALTAELRAAGARPATFAYYSNHARILLRAWDASTPLHAIRPDDLRTYIEVRLADGISLETIWGKELQVLGRIFHLAIRRGALPASPLSDLRKPKLRSRRFDWIPLETAAALLQAVRTWTGSVRNRERDADIIAVALLTGARRAELARLTGADVDLEAGRIFVEGKNRNRYLPIADELRPVLSRLKLRCGDGPLVGSERLIEKVFARWQTRLNEPRLAPRALRHSFATEVAADGATSPFELQLLMGHANLRQTQRYYHGQTEQSRAAVNSLGQRLAGRNPAAETSAPDRTDESQATS